MFNAKSLLDSLVGQFSQTSGTSGGLGQLGDRAKQAWGNQSGLGKGAIAGGLLAVLMSDGGRKILKTGVQVGGVALIGGLAYRAWDDWKAGKAIGDASSPAALPASNLSLTTDAAIGSAFLPNDPVAAQNLSLHLVQAMVAAAKADGHVTETERAKITQQLSLLGLEREAQALIEAELDRPLDAGRIAALAGSEEEAAEIYAASLLSVDPDGPAEKGYLAMLAARLQLDPGLVAHIHARAADLA